MSGQEDWARETEDRVLTAALPHVRALGWTRSLVIVAARDVGLSPADAELLFPGGARDLAALLSARHDRAALEALSELDSASLKVRERIGRAVLARCDAAMADEAAVRRLAGWLSFPANLALGLHLVWTSADRLWRWAGDEATDENHYSKRALLSEILVSTLATRLAGGESAAAAHLDRRIAGVMAFERWKGSIRPAALAERAAAALGRVRYGRR